jgi:Fe2+ transport system protein FeoA
MTFPLSEATPGRTVRVNGLISTSAARLSRLAAYGLVPGAVITVVAVNPAILLRCGNTSLALDESIAKDVVVQPALTAA